MSETTERVVNTKHHNKIAMGFYHHDPRWCSMKDFDRFADLGFVNAYRLTTDSMSTVIYAAERAAEKGDQVWLGTNAFLGSKQTLSEYMENTKRIMKVMSDAGLLDTVAGFQWDEPLLKREHSNADFVAMTKAMSEEFGKRIFPVFSVQELLGFKGNPDDPDGIKSIRYEDTAYVTDAAFDVYGFDFRAVNERLARKFEEISQRVNAKITNSDELIRHYAKLLINVLQKKDAKIWFFPCTYTCGSWSGGQTDEDYCIAHMKSMTDILLDQENPGGLFGYTYKSWGSKSVGLDWHLDRENPNRWNKFDECCKEIYDRISKIEVK